jgi:hypothetical protein
LAITPGIVMTTTASSTPTNTAMTGMAICGRPPPVAPLMNAPTAIAATMTVTSRTPTGSVAEWISARYGRKSTPFGAAAHAVR